METKSPEVMPNWEEDIPLLEEEDRQVEVDAIGTVAPSDAYQVRTRHSFATHPVSKGVIVLGVSFMLMSVLGVFLKAMTGGFSNSDHAAKVTPKLTATTSPQNSITEADTLKAKLMLNDQDRNIKEFRSNRQAQQTKKALPPVVTPPATVQTSQGAIAPGQIYLRQPYQSSQTSLRPVIPAPRPVISTPRRTSPPIETPYQKRLDPNPVISSSRRNSPAIETPVQKRLDPEEQWLAAANVGNYGNVSSQSIRDNHETASTRSQSIRDNYDTPSTIVNSSSWGGIGTPPQQVNNVISYQSNSLVAQSKQVDHQRDTNNQASLIFGTRTTGKLETPIAWSGNLNNPTQDFLIQLKEPLKAADNTVAIPKGAYLRAKVSTATEAGLLQMSVVSVLINSNGRTTERSIPEGAILILGKGGKPLKASVQRPDTTSNEMGMVVLSGISNASSLINRPTSQSIISYGGGYQSTITNSEPNYLAGFGQGATQALVQQMQRRNQQAMQSRQSQPNVFVLDQGTLVQVFVNQSVSL